MNKLSNEQLDLDNHNQRIRKRRYYYKLKARETICSKNMLRAYEEISARIERMNESDALLLLESIIKTHGYVTVPKFMKEEASSTKKTHSAEESHEKHTPAIVRLYQNLYNRIIRSDECADDTLVY